jgi:endonuclease/exonuclease/phosphatase family metal-dependent hydrolase
MNNGDGFRLRILSYNIHKGFMVANAGFILDKIREAIRAVDADVVLLQEVLGDHAHHRTKIQNWPSASQFEFLADQVWPHFAYGKNAVYSHGHHGNAILSKYPVSVWGNVNITLNRFERRGILHGVIPIPALNQPLHVLCLHLNLRAGDRRKQIDTLCGHIRENVPDGSPIIIGGDFNDWRGEVTNCLRREIDAEEAFQKITGRHATSFPAWRPMLPLDRIYVRGVDISDARVLSGRPWNALSDHLALYSEVVSRAKDTDIELGLQV